MPIENVDINKAAEANENLKKVQQQAGITRQAAYQQMMGEQDASMYKQQQGVDPALELQKERMRGGASRLLAGTFGGKYIGSVPIFASIDVNTPYAAISNRDQQLRQPMKWKEIKKDELDSTNKRFGDFLNSEYSMALDNYISGLTYTFGHGIASQVYNNDAFPEGRYGDAIKAHYTAAKNKLDNIQLKIDDKGDAEYTKTSFLPKYWFTYRDLYRAAAASGEDGMRAFINKINSKEDTDLYNEFLNAGDVANSVESLTKNHMKDYFNIAGTTIGWSDEDLAKINAGDFSILSTYHKNIDPDALIDGLDHKLQEGSTNNKVYTLSKEIDSDTGRFKRMVGGKVNLLSVISGMFPREWEHRFTPKAQKSQTIVNIVDKTTEIANYTTGDGVENFDAYADGIKITGKKDRGLSYIFTPRTKSGSYGVAGSIMSSINENGTVRYVFAYNYNGMTPLLADVFGADYPNQTPSQFTTNVAEDGAGYLFGNSIGGNDNDTVTAAEAALYQWKLKMDGVEENSLYDPSKDESATNARYIVKDYTDEDKHNTFFELIGGIPIRTNTTAHPAIVISGSNYQMEQDKNGVDIVGGKKFLSSVSFSSPAGQSTHAVILKNKYLDTPTQSLLSQDIISNVTSVGIGGNDYTVIKGTKLIKEGEKYLVVTVDENGKPINKIPLEVDGALIDLNPNEMAEIINGGMKEANSQVFSKRNWDDKNNSVKYRATQLQQTSLIEPKMYFESSKWATAVPTSGIEHTFMAGKTTSQNFNLLNMPMQAQTDKALTISQFSNTDREFMSLISAYGTYKKGDKFPKKGGKPIDFVDWFGRLDDNKKQQILDGGLIDNNITLYDIFNNAGFYEI